MKQLDIHLNVKGQHHMRGLAISISPLIRNGIIMSGFFSLLAGLFSCKEQVVEYEVDDTYAGLREMALTMSTAELGLDSANEEDLSVIMDIGYPEAVVTLVALADGTVSLYISNGGGTIGLGENPAVRQAASEFIATAQAYSPAAAAVPATDFPLPQPGYIRFHIKTGKGVWTVEAQEDDLGKDRHEMSPLFHKAHEVITQIRLAEESAVADENTK